MAMFPVPLCAKCFHETPRTLERQEGQFLSPNACYLCHDPLPEERMHLKYLMLGNVPMNSQRLASLVDIRGRAAAAESRRQRGDDEGAAGDLLEGVESAEMEQLEMEQIQAPAPALPAVPQSSSRVDNTSVLSSRVLRPLMPKIGQNTLSANSTPSNRPSANTMTPNTSSSAEDAANNPLAIDPPPRPTDSPLDLNGLIMPTARGKPVTGYIWLSRKYAPFSRRFHALDERLEAHGWPELDEIRFWRGNPPTHHTNSAWERYTHARHFLPDWPLPLPYEIEEHFKARREILGRTRPVDYVVMFFQYEWYRRHDPITRFLVVNMPNMPRPLLQYDPRLKNRPANAGAGGKKRSGEDDEPPSE